MSDVRVERQTTDVIGSASELAEPTPRVERQVTDVIGHVSTFSAPRPRVERQAIDVIGTPGVRGESMTFPQQAVQNHTIAVMCHLKPGSVLMLTPPDYRGGGVLVRPDDADSTQARFHYIAQGYTLTSNPFPAFGSPLMIVFRLDVDGAGPATTLRVNGTAVGVTESGAPFGTVYNRIQGALQWPVASSDTQIAELILFGSLVSNANLLVLETYLRDKWVGAVPPGPWPPGAEIGDLVAGGVYVGDIEYPDGRKFHIVFGLQASEASGLLWGPTGTTGATDVNDGRANQALILARPDGESYNAFVYCRDYVDGDGNNDYYLPSLNELSLEANVRAHSELTVSRTVYRWSSTEYSSGVAWNLRFSDGGRSTGNVSSAKTVTTKNVRPVRRVEFT